MDKIKRNTSVFLILGSTGLITLTTDRPANASSVRVRQSLDRDGLYVYDTTKTRHHTYPNLVLMRGDIVELTNLICYIKKQPYETQTTARGKANVQFRLVTETAHENFPGTLIETTNAKKPKDSKKGWLSKTLNCGVSKSLLDSKEEINLALSYQGVHHDVARTTFVSSVIDVRGLATVYNTSA